MRNGNIILTGFMGSGKSTVAACLGQAWGMGAAEMDDIISEREGKDIPEIFKVCGEEYFRNLETALLEELCGGKNMVISCGGGAVLRRENVDIMRKSGRIILLSAKPETIYRRVGMDDSRPLLAGRKSVEDIAGLMKERQGKYEAAADIVIETDDKTASEICGEILAKLGEMEKENA